MSRVRDRDTQPELTLRRRLWARGHRYRLRYRVVGRPDLAFLGARLVVFVDGCFWHGCPQHARYPQANADFWRTKLARNKERDAEVTAKLVAEGWTVLRFWEHQVEKDLSWVVATIEEVLSGKRTKR